MYLLFLKSYHFVVAKVEYTSGDNMKIKNYDVWVKIGLNILHYRKEQRLTQAELAEGCDTSQHHIQRIETAAAGCSIDMLIEIAKFLNIPLYKLFEFKD